MFLPSNQCRDSAPAIYESTTEKGHSSSPLIDQDPNLFDPFIKLQVAYEDVTRKFDKVEATYKELHSSKSMTKVDRLHIKVAQL
jgi:hypothetical protein